VTESDVKGTGLTPEPLKVVAALYEGRPSAIEAKKNGGHSPPLQYATHNAEATDHE